MYSAAHEKLRIYFHHHPELGWSILSLVLLLILIMTVRFNAPCNVADFDVDETIEMIEMRFAIPEQMGDLEVSDAVDPAVKQDTERMPIGFGTDSVDFNEIDSLSNPPRPIFTRTPPYPESMRRAGIEGIVVIELGINERGEVVYGKIVKSLGKDFDYAVVEWAKNIKFYPAKTEARVPMKCRINLPVRFKLEG